MNLLLNNIVRAIAVLSILLFVFSSCGTKEKKKSGFSIKGNLEHGVHQKIYLAEITSNELLVKDSAKIDDDGNFRFYGVLSEPSVMLLYRSIDDPVKLIIDTADQIIVNGNLSNLAGTAKVSGTGESVNLAKMQSHLYNNLLLLDSLNFIYKTSQSLNNFDTVLIELERLSDSILHDEKTYLINFIDENPGELSSYVALTQQVGPQNFIFNPVEDLEIFKKVENGLVKKLPNSKITLGLSEFIAEMEELENSKTNEDIELKPGMYAPEITLKTELDELVSLSSTKGKYVLLVFWATWCKPCRMENPVFVRLHNKYKASKKGFEIYHVSLDRPSDKSNWSRLIKADNMIEWIHVIDEKQICASKYAIENIPLNYLLDQNGMIIAKNLRGYELENKLKELFKY
ncbi:MAG: AhpC/TSA family protein [Bacteroidales bacterium]|nr:AhpC/TSA family protein [Bacteroidales bacterium]